MANSKKITGYTGSATEITIPTSIGGSLVREISNDAFANKGLTKITVNTFNGDIQGSPWGATDAQVVWAKPATTKTVITWDGDGSKVPVKALGSYYYKVSDLYSNDLSTYSNATLTYKNTFEEEWEKELEDFVIIDEQPGCGAFSGMSEIYDDCFCIIVYKTIPDVFPDETDLGIWFLGGDVGTPEESHVTRLEF